MQKAPVKSFAEILCRDSRGVVSLVGGGGKTSLMFGLAHQLIGAGKRVLTTTTTKIFVPTPEQSANVLVDADPEVILRQAAAARRRSPYRRGAAVRCRQAERFCPGGDPPLRRIGPFRLDSGRGRRRLPPPPQGPRRPRTGNPRQLRHRRRRCRPGGARQAAERGAGLSLRAGWRVDGTRRRRDDHPGGPGSAFRPPRRRLQGRTAPRPSVSSSSTRPTTRSGARGGGGLPNFSAGNLSRWPRR